MAVAGATRRNEVRCRSNRQSISGQNAVRDAENALQEARDQIAVLREQAQDPDNSAVRGQASDLFAKVFAHRVEFERALEVAEIVGRNNVRERDIRRTFQRALDELQVIFEDAT